MSPRAAWRLEAFGYDPVYDYVIGKADWLAAGLPTDGNGPHLPRAADAIARSVPTCTPGEAISDVATRLAASGSPICVVVNDYHVVLGRLRRDRLDPADSRAAEDIMEPGPATIRADADLAETRQRMTTRKAASLIVSTPEGVLLGLLYSETQSV